MNNSENSLRPKVGIIGAGNVGIRYAFALMLKNLCRSIVIVDKNRERAEGEVLDLASGMPYVSPVEITCGDYSDLKGSDLVVITAGARQKAGQSRRELVRDNVDIFREIIPKITSYAAHAVFLVVSNPVDVLSYATYKISGKPSKEIIGSGTVLDSSRLRFLLSRHCGVDARNVHAYILGEHGDSEFPVWSTAVIGGVIFHDYCLICKSCDNDKALEGIFSEVKDYAYKIIERKQETSYGIGLALAKISEAILKNQNSILPVSCLLENYYGISDLYMSIPAVVNKSGVKRLLGPHLNAQEQDWLRKSADTIRSVIREAGL